MEEEEKNKEPLHEEKDPMDVIDEIFDRVIRYAEWARLTLLSLLERERTARQEEEF